MSNVNWVGPIILPYTFLRENTMIKKKKFWLIFIQNANHCVCFLFHTISFWPILFKGANISAYVCKKNLR